MLNSRILKAMINIGLELDNLSFEEKVYVFNSLIYLGWCKVLITLIKYIPQAYSNYKRKSTIGWNIHNMLLDFTGGLFSFGQNFVDSYRTPVVTLSNGETSSALNTAKYALSFITMFFDLLLAI